MIHGLTDQLQLPRAGKLRIGEKGKSSSGAEIPKKLDYFKFDPADEALIPIFTEKYGEKPTVLPVMLPSDDPEDVFPHEYRRWTGGKLFCHGDNRIGFYKNPDTGEITQVQCSDECQYRNLGEPYQGEEKKRRTCSPEGTLRVLLYELPTLGVFEITAATMSIIRVNSSLEMIRSSFGHLRGIPLVLILQGVKLKTGMAYVFGLDVRVSLQELLGQKGNTPLQLPEVETVAEEREIEGPTEEEMEKHQTFLSMAGDLIGRLPEDTARAIFDEYSLNDLTDMPIEDRDRKTAFYRELQAAVTLQEQPVEEAPPQKEPTSNEEHPDEDEQPSDDEFGPTDLEMNRDELLCTSIAMEQELGLDGPTRQKGRLDHAGTGKLEDADEEKLRAYYEFLLEQCKAQPAMAI